MKRIDARLDRIAKMQKDMKARDKLIKSPRLGGFPQQISKIPHIEEMMVQLGERLNKLAVKLAKVRPPYGGTK